MNTEMATLKQPKFKVAFWHPNKTGKGSAAIFEARGEDGTLFLQLMPQSGERKFDSNQKITAKLGSLDIAEFLLVFEGAKAGVGQPNGDKFKGLYHSNQNGSTSIHFERSDSGFRIGVGAKRGNDAAVNLSIQLNQTEAMLLRQYLTHVLTLQFIAPEFNGERPSEEESPF